MIYRIGTKRGFGDGNAPYTTTGKGTVYFDDVILGHGDAATPGSPSTDVNLTEDPFVYGYDWYPLRLKPDCPLIEAGGGYIDQYPYLLGKTTGYHPDNNVANIGYHYLDETDWNYVNASGTILSADLNNDFVVNFMDFAILADNWLTIFDMDHLDIMAYQWLETTTGYPPIELTVGGDANTGYVEIGATGYFPDTQRIFVLVDGQYAGEIVWFRGGGPFMLDVSALGPGPHQLKAVGVDDEGLVTCSSISEHTFNCFLNYCSVPKFYEPNKPIYFYGLYSGGDITVKAFEYGGEDPLWSETYSGGNLSGFIPAEVTALDNIDYVTFEEGPSGMMMALSGLGDSSTVSKPTESSYEPNNVRALLILPIHKINVENGGVIKAVIEAFESQHVPYKNLHCWGSNYKNMKKYANKYNINYIYYTGHGAYNNAGVNKTSFEIDDGEIFSFDPRGGDFDLYHIGFHDITLAYFDFCYSGHLVYDGNNLIEDEEGYPTGTETLHSDMSKALRMDIGGSHIFQGWYGDKPTGMLNYKHLGPLVKNPYNYFSIYEWEKLRDGDNLLNALNHAMQEVRKLPYDGDKAMNDMRIRGEGLMLEVKIE